jgi:hypothetical protein
MKHKSKVLAVSAAIAVGLSVFVATPAEACEEPHPTPSPSPSAAASTLATVRVTQQGPGSFFGLLEWPAVAGATEYRIFKTGSIRPRWRLFWITPGSLTKHTISDKPRSIAIYRVVALVNNREIDLGEFTYIPIR